jgi:hypothetical protein
MRWMASMCLGTQSKQSTASGKHNTEVVPKSVDLVQLHFHLLARQMSQQTFVSQRVDKKVTL